MSRILIGNVRDKLVNNLLATKAGTGALDAAQGKVLKDLVESVLGQQADTYGKKTYAVGDYCIYENALYKCSTAISSAEDWTAGHWTKTTIAAELKSIVGSVATVNNAITELNGKFAYTSGDGIRNPDYVSESGFECKYYKYGRVCVVRFAFTPNKDIPSNNQIIATELPLPAGTQQVGLPIITTTGSLERGNLAISDAGNLVNWYGYGLKSGEFVKGGITYITKGI